MKKLMILLVVAVGISACANKKKEHKAEPKQTTEAVAEETAPEQTVTPKEGYTMTESGLQYKVLRDAKGAKPGPTSKVKVHYEGTLLDGKVFDSSYERKEPITFGLNEVIPGWTEGVQLMSVGSMYEFIIPANLAYGPRELPGIPANSTLVFKVELLGIEK